MSMCNYHIAANSLYGLWGIELSNSKKVIYPKYWSQGWIMILMQFFVRILNLVVLVLDVIRT